MANNFLYCSTPVSATSTSGTDCGGMSDCGWTTAPPLSLAFVDGGVGGKLTSIPLSLKSIESTRSSVSTVFGKGSGEVVDTDVPCCLVTGREFLFSSGLGSIGDERYVHGHCV